MKRGFALLFIILLVPLIAAQSLQDSAQDAIDNSRDKLENSRNSVEALKEKSMLEIVEGLVADTKIGSTIISVLAVADPVFFVLLGTKSSLSLSFIILIVLWASLFFNGLIGLRIGFGNHKPLIIGSSIIATIIIMQLLGLMNLGAGYLLLICILSIITNAVLENQIPAIEKREEKYELEKERALKQGERQGRKEAEEYLRNRR